MSNPMSGGGMAGWSMLRSMRSQDEVSAHRLKRGTARRIVAFARPYRRDIVVFLIWSWRDARARGVARWWLVLPATCLVGLSLSLPLYLYLREGMVRE